jgi:hypothetical protein
MAVYYKYHKCSGLCPTRDRMDAGANSCIEGFSALCTFKRMDEITDEGRSRSSPFDIQETLATCEGLMLTQIVTEKEIGTQTTPRSKRKKGDIDKVYPNKRAKMQENDMDIVI